MSDTLDILDETGPEGDDLLAAEFVLNLIEGGELDAARARLVVEPGFAALVAGWQERLIPFADTIEPVAPPKRVRKKLLKQMFAAPRVPLSERVWVWKGLSFAAIALAAYMGIQQLGPEPQNVSGPVYATQLFGESVPLQVLAVLDPARGDIALNRVTGIEASGRAFELWAIVPDAAPISLGVLSGDTRMRIALPEALEGRAAEITLAISDEPAGGSPTGAPTGDVLAAAPVQEL